MLDVYNTLLQLAGKGCECPPFSSEMPPISMPRRDELVAAIERMTEDRYVIPNVDSDPMLKRSLMRICEINRMVLEHASRSMYDPEEALVGAFPGVYFPPTSHTMDRSRSGEMACPECRRGTLCYLLGASEGVFVECSTVDCLYWDSRR